MDLLSSERMLEIDPLFDDKISRAGKDLADLYASIDETPPIDPFAMAKMALLAGAFVHEERKMEQRDWKQWELTDVRRFLANSRNPEESEVLFDQLSVPQQRLMLEAIHFPEKYIPPKQGE